MKQSPPPVQYERQWHRTETLCSRSSKIVPELLVERAWCIKFQSLLLRSAYLLPCQWIWVPPPIHLFPLWSEYRFTLWWKVAENYPLVTIHYQDRRGAASFRNQSRQNHPSCVNGSCIRYTFVSAQERFCIAWTKPSNMTILFSLFAVHYHVVMVPSSLAVTLHWEFNSLNMLAPSPSILVENGISTF